MAGSFNSHGGMGCGDGSVLGSSVRWLQWRSSLRTDAAVSESVQEKVALGGTLEGKKGAVPTGWQCVRSTRRKVCNGRRRAFWEAGHAFERFSRQSSFEEADDCRRARRWWKPAETIRWRMQYVRVAT